MTPDRIFIRGLRASTFVGVPEEERALAQVVEIDVEMETGSGFEGIDDQIEKTVDYDQAAQFVRKVAGEKPRKLIETLAEDLATSLLEQYLLKRVSIEVRKFILPDVDHVAVSVERRA